MSNLFQPLLYLILRRNQELLPLCIQRLQAASSTTLINLDTAMANIQEAIESVSKRRNRAIDSFVSEEHQDLFNAFWVEPERNSSKTRKSTVNNDVHSQP
eukprot:TRINITY_DN68158_c1_g1_i10.p3 TRINITY_DN68158_c1_g1~~TRINITY_DN68158_c1_g1_i10.p3  ORF type:complete len:100 (+),score=3.87 TRINITY_DN68158_c1_g1_i10:229-528(+)